MINKTCLNINCPERFSLCCHATCRIESNMTAEHFVCSHCGKKWKGGECNVEVPNYSIEEILTNLKGK